MNKYVLNICIYQLCVLSLVHNQKRNNNKTMKLQEIKQTLSSQYDYISKYDALKFILGIDQRTHIKNILSAWNDLYN